MKPSEEFRQFEGYSHLLTQINHAIKSEENNGEYHKRFYNFFNKSPKELFNNVNVYELDKITSWILNNTTKNDIFKREHPFQSIIIDTYFWADDILFRGFYIDDEGNVLTNVEDDTYHIGSLFFNYSDENFELDSNNATYKNISKKTLKKLQIFICNFFDFLNEPELRIIKFERTIKNIERRLRQGKVILPSTNRIIVTGELKVYFDKIKSNEHKMYSHKFEVAGHYQRFWNKKRYKKLYSDLLGNKLPKKYFIDKRIKINDKIIGIFIKPYFKGQGIFIKKKRILKKGVKL